MDNAPKNKDEARRIATSLMRRHGLRWGPDVPDTDYELMAACNEFLTEEDRRKIAFGITS